MEWNIQSQMLGHVMNYHHKQYIQWKYEMRIMGCWQQWNIKAYLRVQWFSDIFFKLSHGFDVLNSIVLCFDFNATINCPGVVYFTITFQISSSKAEFTAWFTERFIYVYRPFGWKLYGLFSIIMVGRGIRIGFRHRGVSGGGAGTWAATSMLLWWLRGWRYLSRLGTGLVEDFISVCQSSHPLVVISKLGASIVEAPASPVWRELHNDRPRTTIGSRIIYALQCKSAYRKKVGLTFRGTPLISSPTEVKDSQVLSLNALWRIFLSTKIPNPGGSHDTLSINWSWFVGVVDGICVWN